MASDDPTIGDLPELPDAGWEPPAAFDGFAVERALGRGGMGCVYLARDTALDRPVAIKFIALAAEPGPEARARFLVEARAIARLQHPNVVGVHRLGEVAGRPYLVSEFVDGEPLDVLAKPVPWPRALALGLGAARGLAAAHKAGVLHRDMKPGNVIVTTAGEVKLLDFGIAKLVEVSQPPVAPGSEPVWTEPRWPEAAPVRALTSTGAILGTPLYLAPELWAREPATPRSDVYALGLVLHELLLGDLPHSAAAAGGLPAVAAAVREADAPPLAARAPALPRPLARVVERCLRRDPTQRYADAGEVCEALTDVHAVYHAVADAPAALATVDEASQVAASFGRVAARVERFTARFYELLFARRPDLRPLFPPELGPQRAKLAGVVQLVVDHLRRPERLLPILEDLGLRHAAYGVRPVDFDAVGQALVGALAELDPAWSPAIDLSWRAAYRHIAAAMERGLVEARVA